MENPLITHALKNVWCEPEQDHQHTIHGCRLTKRGGIIQQTTVAWSTITMPINDTRRFHLYQIGRIPAGNVGLSIQKNTWYNVATLLNTQKTVIDVYLSSGGIVPAQFCYVQQLSDQNFVLAVVHSEKIDYGIGVSSTGGSNVDAQTLDNNELYIRFYKNARYDATSWLNAAPEPLKPLAFVQREIITQSDYTDFMSDVQAINTRYGGVGVGLFFNGGFLCPSPVPYRSSYLGKILSYRYDESIKAVYEHPVSTLVQFDSILDNGLSKYLVVTDGVYDTIDYHDDVDFYLTNASGEGLLIARAVPSAVRMVTHSAYALHAGIVNAYTRYQRQFADIQTLKIKIVVRQGGLLRGVVNSHTRVDALYRLPLNEIQRGMAGVSGGPAEWHAAFLENSAYSRLMAAKQFAVNGGLVIDSYGYHAASKVVFPVHYDKPDNNQVILDVGYNQTLPNSAVRRVQAYAYREGLLVGLWTDSNATRILSTASAPPDADTIEVLPNTPENITTDIFENQDVSSFSATHYGFRCYVCSLDNGVPDQQWLDVTNGFFHTVTVNAATEITTIAWDYTRLQQANLYPAVRVGGFVKHMVYTPTSSNYAGWLSVSLSEKIPSGVIDIFMNGQSLIRNIDYTVEWPTVYIVKTPNIPIDDVNVLIRHYGFCSPIDMQPLPLREVGFVRDGMVSVDGIYQVRNHRVGRAIVGGRYYPADRVKTDDSVNATPMVDGRPYALCDYALPIEAFTGQDTTTSYLVSTDLDGRVDQYLTRFISTQAPGIQFVQGQRWEVYSPFMGGVIEKILNDEFGDGRLAQPYNRVQTDQWLANLFVLLPNDPCFYQQHDDFVVIYAHCYTDTVTVTSDEYRFLEYVNRYYLLSRIDITPSVTIG